MKVTAEELNDSKTMCFAVRGETCIDLLIPGRSITQIYNKTLDDVRLEYPNAEEMTLDEFCRSKAAKQDTPGEWEETSEERFDDMLNVLHPAAATPGYSHFMVGEPWDHHATTGQPRFQAFKHVGGKYFAYSRPMTFAEFRQFATNAKYYYVS